MIETARLVLRRWIDSDRPAFHAMCSDPEVMAFLGPLQTRAETDAAIDRQNARIDSIGHSFWAIERREDARFLGFCGLKPGPERTPLAGRLEIGWRLGRAHWGQGYAREAAQASIDWGWAKLDDASILAMTVEANMRSWRLMEKLGMQRRDELAFDHPGLAANDPLRRHIVYEISRPAS